MTTAEFKKIARLLKEAYRELEEEALSNNINLLSAEYDEMQSKVRLAVLKSQGFTLEEYREAKAKVTGFTQADLVDNVEMRDEVISQISEKLEEVDARHIPDEDEIEQIAERVAKKYIKEPVIINKIVERVKEPKIIKETVRVKERVEYNDKPLRKEIENLEKKIKDIPVVDVKKLEKDFLKPVQSLKDSIDMEWGGKIPDFRKLAMGLQGQIDEVRSSSSGGGTPGGSTTQVQYNNAGSFGGISGATTNGTNMTFGTGNLLVQDVKASGSGGVAIKNNSGTTVADFGAGASTNISLVGAVNMGTGSADYAQYTGGTGAVTNTATGSSTDIDLVVVPKGAGKFKVTGNANISGLTASQILATNASKDLVSLDTATYPSLTELSYVKGVTSAIQTQLNGKQATLTLGTGVETALGVNVGTAGAFVVNGGALGTPSSGTVTNLTGTASININGTVGATTPTTGAFTTVTVTDEAYGAGWNGSTQVPTKNAVYDKIETLSGLSWGSSISGTTDGGITLTLSNSSDDAAAALQIVAGNTQSNQPVLADLQIGTSGNVMGVLIQGTGSSTAGAAGTGANHLTLWGNTANNSNKALSIGNGTSYGERYYITARGETAITPTIAAGWTGITLNSAGVTGGNTAVAIDISSNMTSNNNFQGIIDSGTIAPTSTNTYFIECSKSQTATTAINNAKLVSLSSAYIIASANTRERSADEFYVLRSGTTSHASANLTMSGAVAHFQTAATQSSGTLLVSGPVLKVEGPAASAFWTGKLVDCVTNSSTVFAVNSSGSIELGHASDTTISRVSAGVAAIEGVNILTVAGGTMTGNITLGENTAIALDPAGSADGKYTGITITGTAGAALAFGDVIVLDVTDSRWELADANSAASADGDARGMIGVCVLAAAGDGSATNILLQGTIRADAAFPALTVGAPVYLSETAGDITLTKPTTTDAVVRTLGFALTADEIYWNPSSDYITAV